MKLTPCLELFFTELPFADRIAAVADCGYNAAEFWGPGNKDIDAIAKAAELAGISEYDTYDLSLPKDASIDMLSYLLGSTNADMGNTALRAKEFLHL
jgi:hydroxypyruvate isomerase